jgi:hypothetical protein
MHDLIELRAAASRYRRLLTGITDRQTLCALAELADEYDAVAEALERENLTRQRGHEVWEAIGRSRKNGTRGAIFGQPTVLSSPSDELGATAAAGGGVQRQGLRCGR